MRIYPRGGENEALKHAQGGGQAICLATFKVPSPPYRKGMFVAGSLIDHNTRRLRRTARALGVPKIRVRACGDQHQHVVLFGEPLIKAMRESVAC